MKPDEKPTKTNNEFETMRSRLENTKLVPNVPNIKLGSKHVKTDVAEKIKDQIIQKLDQLIKMDFALQPKNAGKQDQKVEKQESPKKRF